VAAIAPAGHLAALGGLLLTRLHLGVELGFLPRMALLRPCLDRGFRRRNRAELRFAPRDLLRHVHAGSQPCTEGGKSEVRVSVDRVKSRHRHHALILVGVNLAGTVKVRQAASPHFSPHQRKRPPCFGIILLQTISYTKQAEAAL
jgi:hypothetical protein